MKWRLIALFLLVTPQVHAQVLDANGNFDRGEPSRQEASGDVINSLPNPSILSGLTFKDGNLWGIDGSALVEMDPDSGMVLSTVVLDVSGGFGLGYDTTRGRFVVSDSDSNTIKLFAPDGSIEGSFPAPSSGPVGAAYDATRDGIWIADFSANGLFLLDAATGAQLGFLAAPPGASRVAGVGYDSGSDVLMFHSRDSAETYLIAASDGSLVDAVPTPPGPGVNNGQGAAIRPSDLTGYLTNYDVQTIFVIDLGLVPAECFLVIGDGPGGASFLEIGHLFETQVGPLVEDYYPVLLTDIPEFVLPALPKSGRVQPPVPAGPGLGGVAAPRGMSGMGGSPSWMADRQFAVQVVMWNPEVFPGMPEQYTAGLFVTIQPDGTVLTEAFGTSVGGLEIWHEIDTNGKGQMVIRFPFSIPGM